MVTPCRRHLSALRSPQAFGLFRAGAVLVAMLAASGCDPRTFDNLAATAWVDSAASPSTIASSDFGAAVISPGPAKAGCVLVAASLSPPGLARISYAGDGTRSEEGMLLNTAATNALLPKRPALASDPSNVGKKQGTVAVGAVDATSGAPEVLLVRQDTLAVTSSVALSGAKEPTAGIAFGMTDAGGAGTPGPVDLVAAGGNRLLVAPDYQNGKGANVSCVLPRDEAYAATVVDADSAAPGQEIAVAMGDTRPGSTPSEIAVMSGSEVAAAAADTMSQDCVVAGTRDPLAVIDAPGGEPDFGTAIVTGDFDGKGGVDIAASAPSANVVYVWLDVDLAAGLGTPIAVHGPTDAIDFGASLAAGDLDGDGRDELIVGDPSLTIQGTAAAGEVEIYKVGIPPHAPVTLYDATPEKNQTFGRAVTTAQFGQAGTVLVVGAAQEVLTYFRTPLAGSTDVRN